MQSDKLYTIVKDENGKTVLEKYKPRYRVHVLKVVSTIRGDAEHEAKWSVLYDRGFRSYYFNFHYVVLSKKIC